MVKAWSILPFEGKVYSLHLRKDLQPKREFNAYIRLELLL